MNGIILTGSIATGKSTVANLLRLYGYTIIDADEVAHNELKKHYKEIKEMFGTTDRKEIGKIVFNDEAKRKQLEHFLHPKIRESIMNEAKEIEKFNIPYFIDIPLYFENGNYSNFNQIVVVYTPRDIQLQRLINRNRISKDEAENLITLQMDIEEKKKKATYVIDNSQNLKHLQKELEKFINQIKK